MCTLDQTLRLQSFSRQHSSQSRVSKQANWLCAHSGGISGFRTVESQGTGSHEVWSPLSFLLYFQEDWSYEQHPHQLPTVPPFSPFLSPLFLPSGFMRLWDLELWFIFKCRLLLPQSITYPSLHNHHLCKPMSFLRFKKKRQWQGVGRKEEQKIC